MKPFFLLLLGFFWSGIATAQYPATNYWFAELGGATPLSQVKQEIYRSLRQKSVSWSPTSWVILNAGFHLESEKNGFIEPFLHIRRLNESAGLLLGLRLGRGYGRGRWFIETEYGGERGSLLSYSTTTQSAGFSYGAGFRYRLTTRMSAQATFLRNHFSQFFQVESQYKHPVRSFVSASLYWNLNVKSDKLAKAPKVKKLSPRRQNRCPYSPSNT